MRVLIAHDDGQLRRLESAIAGFGARPAAERARLASLLSALEEERSQLLQLSPRQWRRSLKDDADLAMS